MIYLIAIFLFLIFLSTIAVAGHLFMIVKHLGRIATVLEHREVLASLEHQNQTGGSSH
jgi:hypothetical protein